MPGRSRKSSRDRVFARSWKAASATLNGETLAPSTDTGILCQWGWESEPREITAPLPGTRKAQIFHNAEAKRGRSPDNLREPDFTLRTPSQGQ